MHGELAAGKLSAPQGLSRLFRVRRGRSSAPTLGRVLPRGCSECESGSGGRRTCEGRVLRERGACCLRRKVDVQWWEWGVAPTLRVACGCC